MEAEKLGTSVDWTVIFYFAPYNSSKKDQK